jgi:hypothetical protein
MCVRGRQICRLELWTVIVYWYYCTVSVYGHRSGDCASILVTAGPQVVSSVHWKCEGLDKRIGGRLGTCAASLGQHRSVESVQDQRERGRAGGQGSEMGNGGGGGGAGETAGRERARGRGEYGYEV